MRRISALLLVVFLLFSLLAGCTSEEKRAVYTINDGQFSVNYELYRFVILGLRENHDLLSEEWTEEEIKELEEDCISVLRSYYGILSLAKDYGIDIDDDTFVDQAESAVEEKIDEYGSEDAFLEALKSSYMTSDLFTFFEICNAIQSELYYAMLNSGSIQTNETTLNQIFHSDEMVRVKQVLIDPDEYSSKEEAYELAIEIQAMARSGEDFDLLVNKYGDDLFMFNNTDGYYLLKGVWYHTFEDTAFSLEEYEISDVIETPAGYSILLRLPKEESYLSAHLSDLMNDYYDSAFSLAIEKRASALSFTPTDLLKELVPLEISMP